MRSDEGLNQEGGAVNEQDSPISNMFGRWNLQDFMTREMRGVNERDRRALIGSWFPSGYFAPKGIQDSGGFEEGDDGLVGTWWIRLWCFCPVLVRVASGQCPREVKSGPGLAVGLSCWLLLGALIIAHAVWWWR